MKYQMKSSCRPPPAAKARAEPVKQIGAETDVRLGRLKAKLDTVLGRAGAKKDDNDKDTPVSQASLEQLKEMLKKKKDVVAKKAKPRTAGDVTLLQKLAATTQASSEGPSRARELLSLVRAEHDRHKEDEEDIELAEEPGKADNKKTSGLKDKKSKRKRKKKKESSSDSSDKDEDSGDGEVELFGSAGRGAIGLGSELERVAARRPGKLLLFTLDAM